MKIKGLNQLKRQLHKLQQDVEKVAKTRIIDIEEMFHENFMQKYTIFLSFQDMLDKSGYEINSNDDFAAIPDEEWDIYIHHTTQFWDWDAMCAQASTDWVSNRLNFNN